MSLKDRPGCGHICLWVPQVCTKNSHPSRYEARCSRIEGYHRHSGIQRRTDRLARQSKQTPCWQFDREGKWVKASRGINDLYDEGTFGCWQVGSEVCIPYSVFDSAQPWQML